MPTVPVLGGKDQATLELSSVFGGPVRVPLVHQAVVRELAARRTGTPTKGRSEVSVAAGSVEAEGHRPCPPGPIRATQWKGAESRSGHPRSYDSGCRRRCAGRVARGVAARIEAGGVLS